MLAFFEQQWIPNYENPAQNERDPLGFILSGDTYEELAWDLVEIFLDNSRQGYLRGSGVGSSMVLSHDDICPSLTRTLKYHESRFTNDWWERQQWMLVDFLGGKKANGMSIYNFKKAFPQETLLSIYLTVLIGRYYAEYHGVPEDSMDPKIAIEWFEKLGYLKWLTPDDPRVLGNIRL